MAGLISVGATAIGTGRFSKVEGTKSDKDIKLERIVNKFKAGKKLTSGELSYLAKKNPAIYEKVLRIMRKREQLEARLEQAATKEEAQQIMMQEMQSIEKFCANSDDDFEKTALVSQMMDAYGEVTKSEAYHEKPDSNAELNEQKRKRLEDKTGQDEIEELHRRQKKKKKRIKDIIFDNKEEEAFGVLPTDGLSKETLTKDLTKGTSMGDSTSGERAETNTSPPRFTYQENPAVTEKEPFNPVTYTARGTPKSTSPSTTKKGTLVDLAL